MGEYRLSDPCNEGGYRDNNDHNYKIQYEKYTIPDTAGRKKMHILYAGNTVQRVMYYDNVKNSSNDNLVLFYHSEERQEGLT